MRRLAPVVYAIVFFDALLMFAIVPLLPDYADVLDLSKTQAGIVIGIYSGAVLIGAIPSGQIADRVGARRITIAGVALMAVSTLVYALAGSFWVLVLARIGQGIASAISWTAALAWLSAGTPPEHRGRALGGAMTAGSLGALLGPLAAGPLGGWLGIRAPFVILAAVAAVLAVVAALPPEARGRQSVHVSLLETVRIGARGRLLTAALLLMVLVAIVSGMLETLIPLRLGDDGYSALAISMVLGVAGLFTAVTQLVISRKYDRLGGIRIALVSIAAMALVTGLLAVPDDALTIAFIFILGTPAISGQYAVAFPLATAGADEVGLPHGIVLGAMNVCWGFGFMVGPAAGAAIAEASSDRVTYVLVTLLAIVTLPVLRNLALEPRECQEAA
ncbi:MAG: transporter, family, putative family transporter protein [Gaiellales bacterium]|jgi:predicted MFS family arabinose efflux permease|nr:transporter, family, putative family transporter protein [Gaiellales bacterium]